MDETMPLVVPPHTAARLLSVSTKHCYDLIRERQLGAIRTPRIMVPVEAIHAYIQARLEPAHPVTWAVSLEEVVPPTREAMAPTWSPRSRRRSLQATWQERAGRCHSCPRL
jgi:hypothetical protein